MENQNFLQISGLKKSFGSGENRTEVLRGLDFTVTKGEICVLLGPSGSGKSTLLNIIGGIDNADSGYIAINGEKTVDMDEKTLTQYRRKHLGYVFHMYNLIPNLNVKENVEVGAYLSDSPLDVDDILKTLGLYEHRHKLPNQLSGGQRQRVAFARALAPNPQVLLLDEPFAAIDAKVRGELRTWLKELVEKLGITSIFVTHDQDEAVEVADEIIITNNGTIEQMGTPLEIYKSPDTPFVAQFIGHTTVVENYDRLKGFDRIENADKAVIRPEFIKISKSGNLDRYQSAAEEGVVTDVVFRGNRMDITVSINGIEVVGERSLEKDLIAVGEKVHVLIYRLYIFDEEKTYLMENSEMQEQDVFYI